MSLIPFANRRIVWCSSLQASQHSSIPHREIPLRFRERAGDSARKSKDMVGNTAANGVSEVRDTSPI